VGYEEALKIVATGPCRAKIVSTTSDICLINFWMKAAKSRQFVSLTADR
jgi:hypothetical protein